MLTRRHVILGLVPFQLVPFQRVGTGFDTPTGHLAPIRHGRRFHIPKHLVEIVGTALGLCGSLIAGPPAWATIENLKGFKAAYPGKAPKAYSCKVCHQGIVGKKGDLNAYGLALQKLGQPVNTKQLTEEQYRTVEKDDADGDGISNLDEILSGTAPGDSASVPKTAEGAK